MKNDAAFEGLKNGNPEALKYVFLQNRPICTRWALRKLFKNLPGGETAGMTKEEARDLYIDSFAVLVENIQRERLEDLKVSFSTYLIAVMRNSWLSRNRNQPLPAPPPPPEDLEDLQEKVRQTLARLDDPCRQMLTLRYFMDFQFEDIARVMNYKNGDVVRNLISRCRNRFRELY